MSIISYSWHYDISRKCQHSACCTAVSICKNCQPTVGLWNNIFIHNIWHLASLWHSITVGHRKESAVNNKKKQKPDKYPELKTCMLWALDFMPTAKYNPMSSAYKKLYSRLHRSLNGQSEANEAERRLCNNWCHTNIRKEMMQCCVVWCMQTRICSL